MTRPEFRDKLGQWKGAGESVPPDVQKALRQNLPEPGLEFRVVHRQAGLGSLGRRRFTALAEWHGGLIAREAKELRTTAWHWEAPGKRALAPLYLEVIRQAVRVADPFLKMRGRWLIRRLAPDCSRIELGSLPVAKEELKLLHAMGWETANIHLGPREAVQPIRRDLRARNPKWLLNAAAAMTKATIADWKDWKGKRND